MSVNTVPLIVRYQHLNCAQPQLPHGLTYLHCWWFPRERAVSFRINRHSASKHAVYEKQNFD